MDSLEYLYLAENNIREAPASLGNLRNLKKIQIMRGNPLDERTLPGALIQRMKRIG